jgi:hypothetical protein
VDHDESTTGFDYGNLSSDILTGRGPKGDDLLNTDSDLMANIYIVLNCRRKLEEHPYGYYRIELKLAFSSL